MKTKILKNNLFGNFKKLILKKRFFSERSKLMKYRCFYNLNLIINHNFYNNFYFFLQNLEKNLIIFYFIKNNFIKNNLIPNFLFKKQIFFDLKNFLKFSKKNKLNFLNINNYDFKRFGFDCYGNNFLLVSKNLIENKDVVFLKNDYNIDLFYKNNFKFLKNELNGLCIISFFLNFNLFFINVVEIYKILILLNLYILNK